MRLGRRLSAAALAAAWPALWAVLAGALRQDTAPETLVGRPLPDLELASSSEPERRTPLSTWVGAGPLVLVFGSSTSLSLAPAAPRLNELALLYAGDARFLWIYLREAQALARPDPATLADRATRCREAQAELGLTFPALVDDLDDRAGRAFDAYPEGSFVIAADGRVVFDGGAEIDPDALELALLSELLSAPPSPEELPAARPPGAGVLQALDQDGDGTLCAAEIDGASAVLRGFDLDGDGVVVADELRRAARADPPPRPGAPVPGSADGASASAPLPEAPSEPEPVPAEPELLEHDGERGLPSFDYDRDGRLSRIEVPRPMLDRWDAYDRNRDGYLDADEQAPLGERRGD
jgi:hypothetical protein